MTSGRTAQLVLAALVVGLAAAGTRSATVLPVATGQGDSASIRLSWSARPERVERCRELSDEELARRPAHMRLRVECEGGFARYHLVAMLDSRVLTSDTVRGGGLRNDRPMHVFEEYRVSPGEQRLHLVLVRIDSSNGTVVAGRRAADDSLLGAREVRESEERQRRALEAVPPSLSLDTIVSLSANQVLLVTYDARTRRLVAASGRLQ